MTRQKRYHERKPWVRFVHWAQDRCKTHNMEKYPYHAGKGIICSLTAAQAEILWNRDKASSLRKPSLDRVDVMGDYVFDNCRFIEFRDNVIRANQGRAKESDPGTEMEQILG